MFQSLVADILPRFSRWHKEVEAAADALNRPPTTGCNIPTAGKPFAGGVVAYESMLLVYGLELVELASENRGSLSSVFRTGYNLREEGAAMYASMAGRADEQRSGEHLKKSQTYDKDGALKCSFAYPALDAVFAAFFAQEDVFHDGPAALSDLPATEMDGLWQRFVTFVGEEDTEKAKQALPNETAPPPKKKPPRRGSQKHKKDKSVQKNDRVQTGTLSMSRMLPTKTPTTRRIHAFFWVMAQRLNKGMDSHVDTDVKRTVNKMDGGPVGAFCACGNNITVARCLNPSMDAIVDPSSNIPNTSSHVTARLIPAHP